MVNTATTFLTQAVCNPITCEYWCRCMCAKIQHKQLSHTQHHIIIHKQQKNQCVHTNDDKVQHHLSTQHLYGPWKSWTFFQIFENGQILKNQNFKSVLEMYYSNCLQVLFDSLIMLNSLNVCICLMTAYMTNRSQW